MKQVSIGFDLTSLKFIASSFLATYCSGVVHPLDLVKTRFQSHDGQSTTKNLVPKYQGLGNALKVIYKSEGLKGLYKGFYVSLLSQASSMSLFFWQYETRKSEYQKEGYTKMNAVTKASTEASIIATLITQPIWVVKTRMLLNLNPKTSEFQNLKKQCLEIHGQYGWKGFLKGLQLSLILSFSGVIQMYSYEGSKILYQKLGIPETELQQKNFFCGGISKIFSVLLSYPITTLRTRIQQNQFLKENNCEKYNGIMDLAKRTYQNEGYRGYYKGITYNLMRGVSQKGLYFYFYEILKNVLFSVSQQTA